MTPKRKVCTFSPTYTIISTWNTLQSETSLLCYAPWQFGKPIDLSLFGRPLAQNPLRRLALVRRRAAPPVLAANPALLIQRTLVVLPIVKRCLTPKEQRRKYHSLSVAMANPEPIQLPISPRIIKAKKEYHLRVDLWYIPRNLRNRRVNRNQRRESLQLSRKLLLQ